MFRFIKMIKRFVINGAPGGGKSTLLYGRGDGDLPRVHYPCLKDMGYKVFGDTIAKVLKNIIKQGKNPEEHSIEALELIIKQDIENFLSIKEGVAFFDKGLPYYEGVAKNMRVGIPKELPKACQKFRYNNPIITLDFIRDYDLTLSQNSRTRTRGFTIAEREKMDMWFEDSFKKFGYKIVRVPLFSAEKEESIKLRLKRVLEILEL